MTAKAAKGGSQRLWSKTLQRFLILAWADFFGFELIPVKTVSRLFCLNDCLLLRGRTAGLVIPRVAKDKVCDPGGVGFSSDQMSHLHREEKSRVSTWQNLHSRLSNA